MTAMLAMAGCRERVQKRASSDGAWSCGAVHDPTPLPLRIGARGRFSLGAIADTQAALPETIAKLEELARRFAEARVDAVAVLGDIGRDADDIARVLMALRGVKVPILAIAGERESENSFHEAVNRARNEGVKVFDLVANRLIESNDIDIVSLPGYPFTNSGCGYRAADLEAVRALVRTRRRQRPLILLGHMPPHGDGPSALDASWGGSNVGDRDVARLVDELAPLVGLFAHVDEAGGHTRATARQLLVNVGSADTIGEARVAIVRLSDGKLSYEALP
jgi:Icc-related predicted phosphoesterase